MDIIKFAEQILDLAADRDHWRREALHYKELFEMHATNTQRSIESSEKLFGEILVATLDPDSGINRMHRAMERDPLKGAVGQ